MIRLFIEHHALIGMVRIVMESWRLSSGFPRPHARWMMMVAATYN